MSFIVFSDLHLTLDFSAPSSQVMIGHGYKHLVDTDEILIMHNAGGGPWLCIMRYYALPYGCLNKRDFSCLQFF